MSGENSIDSIRLNLVKGSRAARLEALRHITCDNALALREEIIGLTTHWHADIRVAALRALRFVNTAELVQVIRDSLHDTDSDVRHAAAELFHSEKIAA